jgi:hypothetical protein
MILGSYGPGSSAAHYARRTVLLPRLPCGTGFAGVAGSRSNDRYNPVSPFTAGTKLAERRVELSIKVVTRPRPGLRTRVIVLVIVIIAVFVVRGTGSEPATAISLVLGAGLAGAPVARALIAGGGSAPARVSKADPSGLKS